MSDDLFAFMDGDRNKPMFGTDVATFIWPDFQVSSRLVRGSADVLLRLTCMSCKDWPTAVLWTRKTDAVSVAAELLTRLAGCPHARLESE